MMKNETKLPFSTGQSVEEKSFIKGYRGAWFRSRIKEINYKTGKCQMEYYDYPDTKPQWIELYKKPPHLRSANKDGELMIRPCYPPICNQSEMHRYENLTEATVVIKSDWQLGDLVDWLFNYCWWSGKIVELLLSDGKAKVEFLPPPLGEGTVEEVLLKDIRPSLDWSPEGGWRVPTQDSGRACAQIIRPLIPVPVEDGAKNCVEKTVLLTGSSSKPSLSSPLSSSLEQKGMEITKDAQKELLENTVPTKQVELIRTDTSDGSPVKQHVVASNSRTQLDSAVAAVWDLEECLRKVKWLKAILQAGDSNSDDAQNPKWENVPTSNSK